MLKLLLLLLCTPLAAIETKEIEFVPAKGWQVKFSSNEFTPWFITTEKNEKIAVVRYLWGEKTAWETAKGWRRKLGLTILTPAEFKKQLNVLTNGVSIYSCSNNKEAVLGAFWKLHSNIWVIKFTGTKQRVKELRRRFEIFCQSLTEGKALIKHVNDLQKRSGLGEVAATIDLAKLILNRKGLPFDGAKAVKLLQKARKADDAEASFQLALIYQRQSKPDITYIFTLLQEAVDKDHIGAMKKIAGLILEYKKDYKAATALLKKAAEFGDPEAMYFLAQIYSARKLAAPKEAFMWMHMAAQKAHVAAMRQVAVYYYLGYGVDKDIKQADLFLRHATERGDVEAWTVVGRILCAPDKEQAEQAQGFTCLLKAVSLGSSQALLALGEIHLNGTFVEDDPDRAQRYYKQAADRGLTSAMVKLAELYKFGKKNKIPVDLRASYKWYKLAANRHDPEGMFGLAVALLSGLGCEKKELAGAGWMKLAADNGHKTAGNILKKTLKNLR